ncbi:neuraminidase-like domain-containing protein [Photorhabdus khanii]|nr:neuraminidase-like domain-containing protein [Photorhabdus khanii]
MYFTDDILEKLNNHEKTKNGLESDDSRLVTLPDVMVCSFPEVRTLVGDALTWGETNFLYKQAQQELKENKMAESRILSRANPQLARAVRLGICQSTMLRGYDDLFPQRASKFVKPGSVASMFSPAGYLTELYREARKIHPDDSKYNLDKRRPDLASLSLSQNNMDDELSTLSLSSELLLNNIRTQENKNYDGVMEMFSTYRLTGETPYHQPYEAVRQAILQRDADFDAFRRNPDVAARMDDASLLAIEANISPELFNILTEVIPDDVSNDTNKSTVEKLLKDNFGTSEDISIYQSLPYLARYYDLTYDELTLLLGMVSAGSNSDPSVQYYRNDQLVTLTGQGGNVNSVLLKRTPKDNYGQFGYIELIPVKEDNYVLNLTIVSSAAQGSFKVGTKGYLSDDIFSNDDFNNQNNVPVSFPVTLSQDRVTIGVTRRGGGYYAEVIFDVRKFPFSIFLLKLNKFIRLYKAAGISPFDIRTVIESYNDQLTIDYNVLARLSLVSYYMKYYQTDSATALVLAGAAISQTAHTNRPSAFTSLFNTPRLNNREFSADGEMLDLTPGASADSFRTGVLKRAFQVNDTELYTLYTLAFSDKDNDGKDIAFTTTLSNLSALYLTRLLASVNSLSVTELFMLISISPYAGKKVDALSADELSGLVSFLDLYAQWLKTQGLTVGELYLMTTNKYSTDMSPDIKNLVTTLKNGLANQDKNLDQMKESKRIKLAAPFIAAATQLASAETAEAVLLWLDQIKPQGMMFKDFWALANKYKPELKPENEDTIKLVSFCQVMGQLMLIVRSLSLTTGVLSLAVTQPDKFLVGATTLAHDIATIRSLARFHSWLQQCGTSATEILSALGDGTLTPAQLAQAMTLDEQMMAQGLAQQDNAAKTFSSWEAVDITLQWVDMASTLGITPSGVAALINLKYIDNASIPSYENWLAVSHTLQGGLSGRQTMQLQGILDESLSRAVSAYAIKNISPDSVNNCDELYSWLLIDSQVSAQVKTTRLAEAIASVQLYVNRALSGQEDGVVSSIRSGKFFKEWDTYNKRYSTWAGVSQLVYYPENYVDPTMRIGQTSMMNEMLQSLSQSQLTSDTVEDAFKTYMTRFEEIANLDIVSGYHDDVSDQKGLTYLIGRSAIGDYYWRSADVGKMSDGKLPANAWSEWKKITAAAIPVSNLIRPVILQSRLYIFWMEEKETATVGKDGKSNKSQENLLKYAHIQHDGTWSAPLTYDWNDIKLSGMSRPGMYCAKIQGESDIIIVIYDGENNKITTPENGFGVKVSQNGEVKKIQDLNSIIKFISTQFDNNSSIMLNTPYIKGSSDMVTVSTPEVSQNGSNLPYLFMFKDTGKILSINADIDKKNVILKIDARQSFNFTDMDSPILKMIPDTGNMGDTFYISSKKSIYPTSGNTDNKIQCVASSSGASIQTNFSGLGREAYIDGVENKNLRVMGRKYPGYHIMKIIQQLKSAPSSVELIYYADQRYVHKFSDFNGTIDTTIDVEKVGISLYSNSGDKLGGETASKRDCYTFDETSFSFDNVKFNIPLENFNESNSIDVKISMGIFGNEGYTAHLQVTRTLNNKFPVIPLYRLSHGAQYLQYGPYRIRVNTLFARQLVASASAGLDNILSMNTQQLPEPKAGHGSYITITLPSYNASLHGTNSHVQILISPEGNNTATKRYSFWSGELQDAKQTVTLFVPISRTKLGDPVQFPADLTSGLAVFFQCQAKTHYQGVLNGISESDYSLGKFTPGSDSDDARDISIAVLPQSYTEAMDFNGANALYFWEMFYYVPIMVFRRLLQESRFTEATQWIKYIWSPDGYLVNDQSATYQWNVRPLQEETTWHSNPLDSTDPDAVAQADPMHYKVATFMAWLDLLIARGDAAYRQLERDTLNEAKMWYMQALMLLGDEPLMTQDNTWTNPSLKDAADKTVQATIQQALLTVRQHTTSDSILYTANSLTSPFLPQQNEKLQGYWQTLAQRLYNLRHNLSIDGQPLSLSIYASPSDPATLLSAAVNSSQGGSALPTVENMPLWRFPVMLESARSMVSQLTQFGSTLLSISERQDAEALSELLQTQGSALVLQSISLQEKNIDEIDADKTALEASRSRAQSRLDSYTTLYDEDVNTGEKQAMDLALSASVLSTTATVSYTVAAGLDAVPNIYGMAFGGSRYGSIARAVGTSIEIGAAASRTAADRLSQSEAYRRRRQEWEIQRNAAESEVKQIDAQLDALDVRREASVLQKTYLETQQSQTQAQLTFLQNKFTSKALYNWLRGKLAAIYYQFYDLTVSRCLMAEKAWQWALNDTGMSFIRPGAWQGTWAGLMAGETLMLNLAQMEQKYLEKDERAKEVMRTVCLSEVYANLSSGKIDDLAAALADVINNPNKTYGDGTNGLKVENKQLQATLRLADLKIMDDYPDSLGTVKRIKQISVTLPALVGPYQDVRAVLSYGDPKGLARGCDALVVSHGMNDSGQFQLDFNDSRRLPFEGIPVADGGTLTMSFPDATGKQKDLLLSLSDMILHIRYTIMS